MSRESISEGIYPTPDKESKNLSSSVFKKPCNISALSQKSNEDKNNKHIEIMQTPTSCKITTRVQSTTNKENFNLENRILRENNNKEYSVKKIKKPTTSNNKNHNLTDISNIYSNTIINNKALQSRNNNNNYNNGDSNKKINVVHGLMTPITPDSDSETQRVFYTEHLNKQSNQFSASATPLYHENVRSRLTRSCALTQPTPLEEKENNNVISSPPKTLRKSKMFYDHNENEEMPNATTSTPQGQINYKNNFGQPFPTTILKAKEKNE
eukprot:Pgem_evm1s4337